MLIPGGQVLIRVDFPISTKKRVASSLMVFPERARRGWLFRPPCTTGGASRILAIRRLPRHIREAAARLAELTIENRT